MLQKRAKHDGGTSAATRISRHDEADTPMPDRLSLGQGGVTAAKIRTQAKPGREKPETKIDFSPSEMTTGLLFGRDAGRLAAQRLTRPDGTRSPCMMEL